MMHTYSIFIVLSRIWTQQRCGMVRAERYKKTSLARTYAPRQGSIDVLRVTKLSATATAKPAVTPNTPADTG